ncbi:type VI secretion system Vgr family protein [Aquincola agrisoli]
MSLGTRLGDGALRFRSLSATEEMGRLYEFHVHALSEDPDVDVASLLGTPAHVAIELAEGTRHFHGLVTTAGIDGMAGKLLSVRMVLRPWLWLLTRRADTRIFQQQDAQQILNTVFEPYAHNVAFELSGSLPTYDYCVQYRETDFNFVSRLMEQEGLYYYFRHTEGGHTLVVVDKMSAHTAYAGHETVKFRESLDGMLDLEAITQWRTSLEVQPGKVTLNDYNFTTPETSLLASTDSARSGAVAAYEHYDPPGDYQTAGDGSRYAALRMEELDARHLRVTGSGNVRGLAVGHRFTLAEHPRAAENAAHVLLATRIDAAYTDQESGQGTSHFHCSFTATAASEVFRPQRTTPKPTVPGPQTAVVVGPSGDEIHTDEYGRVKVQFHWDRQGQKDENSSCWVRVSQPLAGKGFGMIALPRIGQEVLVDFVEGDPDRPVVTGRVYNDVQKVPYALPANKTVATLRTMSTPGAAVANFNELRFEDKAGSEYIWFQAEKDFYQYVKNDKRILVDNDEYRIVKNNQNEEIKQDVQRTIGKDLKESVAGNQSLKVTGHSANQVDGAYGLKVTGDLVLKSAAAVSAQSGADMVQKVGANLGVEAAANVHIKGGANVVIEAGAMLTLKCGGGSVVIGPANVAITGAMVLINSGGGGGSGGGASPKTPEATQDPQAPEVPTDPLA